MCVASSVSSFNGWLQGNNGPIALSFCIFFARFIDNKKIF
jgi:hypothetical protein